MSQSKIMQIFLKDSDPDGIKIAELSNSTAKVYVIPRDQLDYCNSRQDLATPALYFLFDDERTSVYIGECENFQNRIYNHAVNKSFWQWAVALVGNGVSLDKADVKYLESHSVARAVEAGRYEVHNRTSPNSNSLHEFKQAAILDIFADAELLLSTLGFNVFDPLDHVAAITPHPKLANQKEEGVRDFDTVVCPSVEGGLEQAFIAEKAWYAIRIGQDKFKKLRYVSLYETAPISAIRYYAKITKIEPYEKIPGKYIIHHDGDIKEFSPHIVMGDVHQLALFGPRYYKLSTMQRSKSLAELTDQTYGTNYSKINK